MSHSRFPEAWIAMTILLARAVRAFVLAFAACVTCAHAAAASYRCDGNTWVDRPIAGRNCVEVTPRTSRAATGAATSVANAPAGDARSPYRRPARVQWQPQDQAQVDAALATLPKDARGRIELGGGLVLDPDAPRGPVQVLAGCASWITGCYAPDERSLDACWASVPTCASADGIADAGECCPAACLERYESRRTAGTAPDEATYVTLFGAGGSCIPGIPPAAR